MRNASLHLVLGSLLLVVGCVDPAVPDDVDTDVAAKPAPSIAGIWTGVGYAQPSSPFGLDHDTDLHIACGHATGSITYAYPDNISCDSLLALTSYVGSTYTYADDSQTAGCTDGTVTLATGTGKHAGQLLFTWQYPDGTIDTRGYLTKIASGYCP